MHVFHYIYHKFNQDTTIVYYILLGVNIEAFNIRIYKHDEQSNYNEKLLI